MKILPIIVATLTQHPRFQTECLWYENSWSGNLFVLWRKLFGQRCGKNGVGDTIRAEAFAATDFDDSGREIIIRKFYTWESLLVHAEHVVKEWFRLPKFELGYINVLQFSPVGHGTREGFRIPIFSFAIAFDTFATETGLAASSKSITYTVTGSNPVVMMTEQNNTAASDTTTSATYNGVAATETKWGAGDGVGSGASYGCWSLLNPTTAAGVTATINSSGADIRRMQVSSYSGVKQSGFPDNTAGSWKLTETNHAQSITSLSDNCWGFMAGVSNAAVTAGTNTTVRTTSVGDWTVSDTGSAQTPAGAFTMNWTFASSGGNGIFFPFAPAVTATTKHYLPLMGIGT